MNSRVRCQVIGVQTQMQSFNFFFGIQLGVLVLRHTDNSSSTYDKHKCTCHIIKLRKLQNYVFQLQGMREEGSFRMFFEKVRAPKRKLEINDPKLPKKRKVSSHYEEGEAPAQFVSTVEEHYRQIFCQVVMVVSCIRDRIQQKDYIETLQAMEILLLKVFHEEDFDHEL